MGSEDTDFDFSSSDLSHCRVHMSVGAVLGPRRLQSFKVAQGAYLYQENRTTKTRDSSMVAFMSITTSFPAAVSKDFELRAYWCVEAGCDIVHE